MPPTLYRGRLVITKTVGRSSWDEIADGAILVENGVIAAVDGFEDLRARHRDAVVVGSSEEVILPGFVNAHHHVGLTPVQLGSPDLPLELWWVAKMGARYVDPYLDAMYSAFEMIASGVTTVQHIQGWLPGLSDEAAERAGDIIRAYEDIGMRVSYSFMLRDQNRLGYHPDETFIQAVPPALQPAMRKWFGRFKLDLAGQCQLFEMLHERHGGKGRVRIQLSPGNLHWCSDAALERVADLSERYDAPMHIHLLETPFQKEYAKRRTGGSAVEYLDRFGMLGPRLTIGHGVWLSESDIELVAATGTCVCHNCSSNFRLRSGMAPLNRLEASGVTTAIGIDEAGINDDRDMLQEMRLVLRAHRTPGIDEADVPTMAQVLRMATAGGAGTTAFAGAIGTIEVGKEADFVFHDWKAVAYPFLDAETPVLDAILQRAKSGGVTRVVCAGETIYEHGRFLRVDRQAVLGELHCSLSHALTSDEAERRELAKALLPFARKYLRQDYELPAHRPHYVMNACG